MRAGNGAFGKQQTAWFLFRMCKWNVQSHTARARRTNLHVHLRARLNHALIHYLDMARKARNVKRIKQILDIGARLYPIERDL